VILHQAFAMLTPQHALWIDSAGEDKGYQLNVQLIERRGRRRHAEQAGLHHMEAATNIEGFHTAFGAH
jgi:hypothetical protein